MATKVATRTSKTFYEWTQTTAIPSWTSRPPPLPTTSRSPATEAQKVEEKKILASAASVASVSSRKIPKIRSSAESAAAAVQAVFRPPLLLIRLVLRRGWPQCRTIRRPRLQRLRQAWLQPQSTLIMPPLRLKIG